MVVVILILLSLGVAGFIMLTDTKKNDNFKRLEQRGAAPPDPAIDPAIDPMIEPWSDKPPGRD